MKRISTGWYVTLVLWLIIGIVFIVINGRFDILSIDDTHLILGLISVGVSIVSLGIATMRNPKFRGDVFCWNIEKNKRVVNNKGAGVDIGVYDCISFEINNYNKTPINNLTINFRMPQSLYYSLLNQNSELTFRDSKDTIIATFTNLKFLGSSNGDCDVIIDHFFNIDKWSKKKIKRVVYVTVAGDNIRPTTFKLHHNYVDQLKSSNTKNKIKLKR